jgi:hypothetical protein
VQLESLIEKASRGSWENINRGSQGFLSSEADSHRD